MKPATPQPIRMVDKHTITSWVLGFLSLFLLVSGCYLAFRQFLSPQPEVGLGPPPVMAEQTNLTITVSANGVVEPDQVVNVSPKSAGILKALMVDEGDRVSAGQVIAKMDDANLQGQLVAAQGRLAAAEANLDKLVAGNRVQEIAQAQARLDSAQANLQQAEESFNRYEFLLNQGAISQEDYDEKLAQRDSAQATVNEAAQELSLMQEGTRQEEIAQARADVVTAQGTLQTIQTEIDDTVIRAPFDGIVAFKYADPGSFVTPTTSGSSVSSATSSSILSIVSRYEVVSNVAETNIAQIQVGQPVTIAADAFPGKTFHGQVAQIATQATVEQNVTSFEVTTALDPESAAQLRAGMNVSTEFQVGERANVLAVPAAAVTLQDNNTGVYVGAPNQPPRFVPIEPGITVNNMTEVKSGLDGSEHILLNVPSQPPPRQGFSLERLFGGGPGDGPPGGGPPGNGPPGGAPAQGGPSGNGPGGSAPPPPR